MNRAARISLLFLLFAVLWILGSDLLVGFIADAQLATLAATYKGLAFVTVSALLLYVVLGRAPADDLAVPAARAGGGARISLHLTLLLLLAVVPLALLGLRHLVAERQAVKLRSAEQVMRLAQISAAEYGQFVEGARQLLATLAQTQRVRDGTPADCENLLRDVARQFPQYLNLAVANSDGGVRCSAVPLSTPINVADRSYFRLAISGQEFVVGEYQIGRLARRPGINFAAPVRDWNGRIKGVVYVVLDLRQLAGMAARLPGAEGWSVLVTGRDGVILTHHPDHDAWVGKHLPETPLIDAMLRKEAAAVELPGLDGLPRLYATAAIAGITPEALRVAVGLPLDRLIEPLDQVIRNIAWSALAIVLLVGSLGWLTAATLIVRPVRALLGAARRLGQGDPAARAPADLGARELRELGGAFNGMAEALQAAEGERRRREETLRDSEVRFRATFEQAAVGIALVSTSGRWLRVNRKFCEIVAYSADELLQLRLQDITDAEDIEADLHQARRMIAGEIGSHMREKRYRRKDGSIVWVKLTVGLVHNDDGSPAYFVSVVEDISARRRLELLERGNGVVLAALARGEPLPTVLGHLVAHIEAVLPDAIGSVLLLDADGRHLRAGAAPGLPDAYNAAIDGAEIGASAGSCGTAAWRRERVIVEDIFASPLWADYRELATLGGVRACWSQPILAADGQVLGTFAVYYRLPHRPSTDDLEALDTAASLASLTISRMRLEETRQTLAQRIASMMESMTDGFVALDREWRYIYVNRKAGELFGRTPESLLGKVIWDEFPEGRGQPFHQAYEQAMREQRPIQLEQYYAPWQRWFENRIYPSADGLSIYFQEITERKRHEQEMAAANQRLHALSAQVLSAQEEERRILARELHDEIGQSLTALKLSLQSIGLRPEAAAVAERLHKAVAIADDTLNQVRRLSLDLRPPQLDELGLAAALRWNLERQAQAGGLAMVIDIGELPPRLPDVLAITCYRLVQEAVTNILRHAGARRVEVTLACADGRLSLRVRDDGRGFDVAAARERATQGAGFGLSGMQERAALAGGSLEIDSTPGAGSEVRASFALANPDEGE